MPHFLRPRVPAGPVLALFLYLNPARASDPGWQVQLKRYPDNLWLVSAVSREVCWILGVHGTVLRTVNAGGTWAPAQDTRIAGKTPTAIAAFSADVAVVGISTSVPWFGRPFGSTDTSWILRTSDGGRTWHEVFCQPGGFFNGLHRMGGDGAICLGNPVSGRWTVLTSSDGGRHWTFVAGAPVQAGAEVGGLGCSTTWGNRHVWFGALDERSASTPFRIYRSTDGGAQWAYSILPALSPHTLDFRDSLVGIVTTGRREIGRSTDGGKSWSAISLTYDAGSGDVAVSPDGQIWLTQHRSIFSSTDAGLSWTQLYQAHPIHQIVMKLGVVMEGDSLFGWATTWTGGIIRYEGRATGVNR
jgi:photosystem II stability/assembly factor-like uncharacterized protein